MSKRIESDDSEEESLFDSCSSAAEDELSERKINEMLYPIFDIAAGLMPVLMEESDESFSSKSDPRSD
jgi:hypothetical protein